MLKKSIAAVLMAGAVLMAAPVQARADVANVYFRWGVITDKGLSFDPFLWTNGLNFDLNFGSNLFLSADVDLIVYKFNFKPLWLTPSVMLNLDLSGLYFGAGISKMFIIGSGYTLQSSFLFKANAGFKSHSIKLQVFAYSPFDDLLGAIGVGANIGFGF